MSGTKFDSGKPDLSLIPYCSEVAEAEALMIGQEKYGRYNFEGGHKASQIVAAIKRHAGRWMSGEERDPDGQHHLGAIKANCSMLLRQIELGTLIDDRSKAQKMPTSSPRWKVNQDGTCDLITENEVDSSQVVVQTNSSNTVSSGNLNWDLHRVQDGYIDSEEPKLKVCKCEKED